MWHLFYVAQKPLDAARDIIICKYVEQKMHKVTSRPEKTPNVVFPP
jgi:hypothetical protein